MNFTNQPKGKNTGLPVGNDINLKKNDPLKDFLKIQNEDLSDVLSVSGQAIYRWDIKSNKIYWSANVEEVLNPSDTSFLTTAGGYNMLVDAEIAPERFQEIAEVEIAQAGETVPYLLHYKLFPNGRSKGESFWVEERGRSYSVNGQDVDHAFGVISVLQTKEEIAKFNETQDPLFDADTVRTRSEIIKHITDLLKPSRVGEVHGILMAEIRNLRTINESFGYTVGDQLVEAVGVRLRNKIREGDLIGQYSSNKFVIVVHGCTDDELEIAAQRFLRAVREDIFKTSAGPISMTISVGGVIIPDHGDEIELVLNRLQDSLKKAVDKGKDTFELFSEKSDKDYTNTHNTHLANEIVSALNDRRMVLAMQPIVSSKDKKPVHYECLVRMENEQGDPLPAAEFIPIAEQLGLNRLIDYRVLELAIQAAKQYTEISLAINVSANTISDNEWINLLTLLVDDDKSISSRLTIEITETALLDDIEQTQEFVQNVKEMGCKVAIDDFGAGYTSFRNLKLLDVDIVKIDGEFIRNMDKSKKDQLFVQAMHELATNLGMETVAEYVSSKEVSHLLDMIGVSYQQGYLFGKPQILVQDQVISETGTAL